MFISTRLGLPENQSIQIRNNSGMYNHRSPLLISISITFQLLKSLFIYPNPLMAWNSIKSFTCLIPLYPYNTKTEVLLSQFYRWENWGLEKWRCLIPNQGEYAHIIQSSSHIPLHYDFQSTLCHPLNLSYHYHFFTNDKSIFLDVWPPAWQFQC